MKQLVTSLIFVLLLFAAFIAATGCEKENYPIQGTYKVTEGDDYFYLLFKEWDLIESFKGSVNSRGSWCKFQDTVVTCNSRGYHSWVAEKTYSGWIFKEDTSIWTLVKID